MAVQARLKNEFTEDEKCQNLMSWLIYRPLHPSPPPPEKKKKKRK